MYDFTFQRPTSLEAATKALAAADDGKYLAGGMTLIPTMKQRLAQPSDLIDLGAIDALSGIRREGDELADMVLCFSPRSIFLLSLGKYPARYECTASARPEWV